MKRLNNKLNSLFIPFYGWVSIFNSSVDFEGQEDLVFLIAGLYQTVLLILSVCFVGWIVQ
tara:strand:+ start:13378 stop:13557 length:180 start_codon:yes stop_codon:yes gene_type:complete